VPASVRSRPVPGPAAVIASLLALAPHLSVASESPAAAAPAPAAEVAAPLTLDQAMAIALTSNRALRAALLGRDVAKARVSEAAERPNPDLFFEEERETPHDALTLSFPLEIAGKRRKRIDVAEAEGRGGEAEIARAVAETRLLVRRSFFSLAASERRVEELGRIREMSGRARDAAKERFDAGAAPRLELVQADLAAADADNALREAKALLVAARAGLNTALARPPGDPIEVAADFGSGGLPSPDEAAATAEAASPEVAAIDRGIEEAEARVRLARAARVPDPILQGSITHRSDPEFDWGWRAGVGITLPLFTTHRAAVAFEESTLARLRAEREAAVEEIRGEIAGSLAVASSLGEQYARYQQEMIPRALEVETMAEDSYRSGQTGLVVMLQVLQTARDLRLRAVQAGLDYQIARADLERSMGTPLP